MTAETMPSSAAAGPKGEGADAPTEIPPRGWKDILWRTYQEIMADRVMLIAAGVTYYLLLALVPSLTAFISIYGLFTDPATVTEHIGMLSGVVPSGGMEIITDQLNRLTAEGNTTLGWALLISLGIALWSASSGMKSLFEAMNVAYDETEKRGFFKLNLLALAFTLGAIFLVILMIAVVVVIPVVLSVIPLGPVAEWAIRIASYAVELLLLSLAIAALYRWGPSKEDAEWQWISPGAVLATIAIVAASLLFSWYLANFSDYNATYGSLGALIGLLTWIWLAVTIITIGGELNSEVENQAEGKTPEKAGAPDAAADDRATDRRPSRYAGKGMSLGTLALALPAALTLSYMQRRRARKTSG